MFCTLIRAVVVLQIFFAIGVIAAPKPAYVIEDFCKSVPDEAINVTMNCIKKLNIRDFNLDGYVPNSDHAIDPDFDDKCLARCVFNDAKLINDNGEPIIQAFKDDIIEFHPKKYHEQLTEITVLCIDLAENHFKSSGGAKSSPCKFSSTIAQCLATEEFKLCSSNSSMEESFNKGN